MGISKQELRKTMRQMNRSLPASKRAAHAEAVWPQIERLEAFARAHTVALFCSLDDEPDTAPALARWSSRKRLVVPRVEGEVMRFYDYRPAVMSTGSFGISEPETGEAIDPATIDLMLVPGVAFTASGERMGRGKGFYDKYLVQLRPDAVKVGICYPHQLTPELPTEPHDVKMDCVVTGHKE